MRECGASTEIDDSSGSEARALGAGLDDVSQPRHVTGARLGSGRRLGQGFSGAQIGCGGATSFG